MYKQHNRSFIDTMKRALGQLPRLSNPLESGQIDALIDTIILLEISSNTVTILNSHPLTTRITIAFLCMSIYLCCCLFTITLQNINFLYTPNWLLCSGAITLLAVHWFRVTLLPQNPARHQTSLLFCCVFCTHQNDHCVLVPSHYLLCIDLQSLYFPQKG